MSNLLRLVSDGSLTVNSSSGITYNVTATVKSDASGYGFTANDIAVGMKVYTRFGYLYEITAITSQSISSVTMVISQLTNIIAATAGAPGIGQVLIFDQGTSLGIPEVLFNPTTGAPADLLAAVATYNSRVNELFPEGNEGKSAYEVWLDAGNVGTVADFLEDITGPVGPPGPAGGSPAGELLKGFSAAAFAEQIVPPSWTKIVCEAEDYDTDGWYSTSTGRFTPQEPGWYMAGGTFTLVSLEDGKKAIAGVYKNGSLYRLLGRGTAGATDYAGFGGSGPVYMNGTTDYIELYGFHNNSVGTNTGNTAFRYTSFWAYKLEALQGIQGEQGPPGADGDGSGGGGGGGNTFVVSTEAFDPENPSQNWVPPGSPSNDDTAEVHFPSGVGKYRYTGTEWELIVFIDYERSAQREAARIYTDDINQSQPIETSNFAYTFDGKHYRTYFAWMKQTNLEVSLSYYDHRTKTFGPVVGWGIPRVGASDTHAGPAVVVAADGHIIVFQEQLLSATTHNSPIHIRRSTNPEDISSWAPVSDSPFADNLSYLYPVVFPSGVIHLYARNLRGVVACLRSEDNGVTWRNFDGSTIVSAAINPGIISLSNDDWAYHKAYHIDGGVCIITRPREDQNTSAYPHSHALFSRDGLTYGNWLWWVSKGAAGVSKTVNGSNPFTTSELDTDYLVAGSATPAELSNTVFEMAVADEYLILLASHRGFSEPFTRRRVYVYDREGSLITDTFVIENVRGFDPGQARVGFCYIVPVDVANGVFSLITTEESSNTIVEFRTTDFGNSFDLRRRLMDIPGNFNQFRVRYEHSRHHQVGVLYAPTNSSPYQLRVYVADFSGDQWAEEYEKQV